MSQPPSADPGESASPTEPLRPSAPVSPAATASSEDPAAPVSPAATASSEDPAAPAAAGSAAGSMAPAAEADPAAAGGLHGAPTDHHDHEAPEGPENLEELDLDLDLDDPQHLDDPQDLNNPHPEAASRAAAVSDRPEAGPGEAPAAPEALADVAAGGAPAPISPPPAAIASSADNGSSGNGGGDGREPSAADRGDDFPDEVEMPLVDHLEELRRRVLRSLLAVVVAAAGCLVFVRPLVRLLEVPAQGIRFLQLAPGEFLFVSLKVAGYAGLTLALPWVLFEALAFVLPGLSRREQRLVAPAVAGSSLLFAGGLAFAWWALVPAALRFLVSYGADVVEPLWSIERYLDFVLLLMVATALAFQLPVLQLLLGALGLVDARRMLGAWRWVVLSSALAGAVLTPSTDPVTMLLLSGAITALYLIGIGLVVISRGWRPPAASGDAAG